MVYLTRKEHFNAAHKLYKEEWSKEKNDAVFGACANEHFHGHNYELFVTVKGQPNEETGFVIDAKKLSTLIQEHITTVLDHKNLNTQVAMLQNVMPTTENLAKAIFNTLQPLITECELHCVKLYETENIYAEYFGE